MIRFALIVIILGLIPFAVYWMKVAVKGDRLGDHPVPVPSLILQSLGLIITAMVLLIVFSDGGSSRGGRYVPPVVENGEVVAGHFEEDEPEEATSP